MSWEKKKKKMHHVYKRFSFTSIFITQVMLGLLFSSRTRFNPPPPFFFFKWDPPPFLFRNCHTDGRCWTLMCGPFQPFYRLLTLPIAFPPFLHYILSSKHIITTSLSVWAAHKKRKIHLFSVGVFCTPSFVCVCWDWGVFRARSLPKMMGAWSTVFSTIQRWPPNRLLVYIYIYIYTTVIV